ncbi:MAG: hypothetical protein LBO65_04775 [Spirochaetaceae bacterium]|nr:hypothetical protein [Spirochaetaceae bacterium]
MKKSVVPRFLFLLVLYTLIFILLVQFQFAKRNNFTHRVGNMVVQGHYGPDRTGIPSSHILEGDVSVFFGGLEFRLGKDAVLAGPGGTKAPSPQIMTIADNAVYFQLDQGPSLIFMTQYTGGAIELVIRADFSGTGGRAGSGEPGSEGPNSVKLDLRGGDFDESTGDPPYTFLELPFRPLATSTIRGGDPFLLNSGGSRYTFSRNTGTLALRLETQNPVISYRAIPERQTNLQEFIIPAALNEEEYERTFTVWLDQSYSEWNRTASRNPGEASDLRSLPGNTREEMIIAYMSEALKRGTYKAAAAAVSASYDPPASYEGSAYVGRLDGALRILGGAERERSARIARFLNEGSPEFLKEFHVIEYLGIRGYGSLMNDAAEMLRTFAPEEMTTEQAAGFLEGRLDWERYNPGGFNPYDRFVDQALFVITGGLRRDPQGALVFFTAAGTEEADAELNLRLGSILVKYDGPRAALGRTLILSILSLADSAGTVPSRVILGPQGKFTGKPGAAGLGSPRIYRIAGAGSSYARAQVLEPGLWAWTAATSISGNSAPGRTSIGVSFFPGETHYLIIRGIRPFRNIQINGINVPSDPQFERFDASGWIYSAAEQTLLVKLRHRSPTEQINVIY